VNLNRILYAQVTLLDVITAVVIICVALMLAKGIALYLRRMLKDRLKKDHLDIVLKLVYYTIIIVAVVSILPSLGVKLSGLLVAGGIVGIAIGFASQSVIGNLISGLFLMIERPLGIGSAVNIDGTLGIVEDIHILSTTLRTFDGLFIRVPNQKAFTANITNFAANVARRVDYMVGIRYSDDAERAIEIIKNLIKEYPLALVDPEPLVFVDNLGESSVDIAVRLWAPTTEWFSVKTKLLWKIKKSIEAEGIEIPFPQRVVWFANELKGREIRQPEDADVS
jgi:small-conductance mechanosensitive channel